MQASLSLHVSLLTVMLGGFPALDYLIACYLLFLDE